MRKILVLVSILAIAFFSTTAIGSVNDNQVTSQKIAEADGTSGQNTNSGSGVKTGHIQDGAVTGGKIADAAVSSAKIADGAVTDAKIAGPIPASKISSTGLNADTVDGQHAADLAPAVHSHTQADVTGLPAALAGKADVNHNHDAVYRKKNPYVIVVAASGGDFTSLQDALNAINPTAETPYQISILPGVYTESVSIANKGYFTIQGAGRDVVTIVGGLSITGGTNFTVAGVGISQNAPYGNALAIANCTAFTIRDNSMVGPVRSGSMEYITGLRITGSTGGLVMDNSLSYFMDGIYTSGSSVNIRNNTLTGDNSYFNHTKGIYVDTGNCRLTGNTISNVYQYGILALGASGSIMDANTVTSAGYGIYLQGPSMAATRNTITSASVGIMSQGSGPAQKISGNMIEGSVSGIYIWQGSSPVINYNTITGSMNFDIFVNGDAGSTTIISNTYNTISGSAAGRYNADAAGNPVLP